jgi:hypothetical protein
VLRPRRRKADAAAAAVTQTSPPPRRRRLSVDRPFLGGVPSHSQSATGTLSLSIADTLNRALAHNLRLLLSSDGVDRARGAHEARPVNCYPTSSGRFSGTRQQINLAA